MTTQLRGGQTMTTDLGIAPVGDTSKQTTCRAGKYLTFSLGGETYGLGLRKIQGIIGMKDVTRTPGAPCIVRGDINLHGEVISVVDLCLLLGLESQEDTERTCIIVAQIEGIGNQDLMGLLVDDVYEVLNVGADEIEDTPALGVTEDAGLIMGAGRVDGTTITLLDAEKVLSTTELLTTS